MLQLDLKVAVSGEDGFAQAVGEGGPAAALAARGGGDQRLVPGFIHRIDEEPGPAITEVKLAGGFGERAADGDLFEEVGQPASVSAGRLPISMEIRPRICGSGAGPATGCDCGRGGGGGFFGGALIHRRWRS